MNAPDPDRPHLEARLAALEESGRALLAEVIRLTAERDTTLRMFSKCTFKGRLDMPNEWHVERGRLMAGLKPEAPHHEESS